MNDLPRSSESKPSFTRSQPFRGKLCHRIGEPFEFDTWVSAACWGVWVVRESIATIGNAEGIFEVPAQSLSYASTDVNPRPTACLGARLGPTSTAGKGPKRRNRKEQENETNFAARSSGDTVLVLLIYG